MRYTTDGVHLYEVEGHQENYGLAGGAVWIVRDVVSETARRVWPLEQSLLRTVPTGKRIL